MWGLLLWLCGGRSWVGSEVGGGCEEKILEKREELRIWDLGNVGRLCFDGFTPCGVIHLRLHEIRIRDINLRWQKCLGDIETRAEKMNLVLIHHRSAS